MHAAMPSLVDRFCPNVHDAAITATAHDSGSGTWATADSAGRVAVTRPGERAPGLILEVGACVQGALCLIQGGKLLAVGTDDGTIAVYRCDDGGEVFVERREGARGRVRAMRGCGLSPDGARLAAIAADGLIRVWSLGRKQREVAWQGFGGRSVAFDARGDRLLCVDNEGQVRLIDLRSREGLPMDRLQIPAERAIFTPDNVYVVAAGAGGISLLRVADGVLVNSFATRGGSGISNVVLSPDGTQAAAITQRSAHSFALPSLNPAGSTHHGAPQTSGAALWIGERVQVAGSDGLMHAGRAKGGIAPVSKVGGVGPWRVAVHRDRVALWVQDERRGLLQVGQPIDQVAIDRDGRLLVALTEGGLQVYSTKDGKRLFSGGPDTAGSTHALVGGPVIACMLPRGGVRWWDLAENVTLELDWPTAIALSGSGTWMAAVTPVGSVRLLDPRSGTQVLPDPEPLADVPVVRAAFMNRRPGLLVLDEQGVLGHYDLGEAIRQRRPAIGRDVIELSGQVDAIWGLTGGQHAVLRMPEGDRSVLLTVDVEHCDVVAEVTDLHPDAWVDVESGRILEPARAGAVLEREADGAEARVLRSLAGGEWIAFGARSIRAASDGAKGSMG